MYKAYILDDEPKAIDNLEFLIRQVVPEITIIKRSNKPAQAIQEIQSFKPDILFLDVQMPHLDGFGVIKTLGNVDFDIVFITAYEEYALNAIKISALDYLLKPIDNDDLINAFQKFKQKRKSKEVASSPELLDVNIKSKKIAIHQVEGIHFFDFDDIIRMESDGNYTKVFAVNNTYLISSKTLKVYEDLLTNEGFIRVHNSHLVNHNKIRSIVKYEYLILSDGSQVPLSRRKKNDLKKIMGLLN